MRAFGRLGRAGALRAVLPCEADGCGLGTAPEAAPALCDILRRVGRADLSLARLYEGHVNAARLVETHGGRQARTAMRQKVDRGAVLGVWGADGPEPLRAVERAGTLRLEGAKRFASGLGHVTHAIVIARACGKGAPQMYLGEVADAARHRAGQWTASAMRATRSGGFDATGIVPAPEEAVGRAGDLLEEPHFEGGIWRYCAAHVGGAEGLIDAWRGMLARTGLLEDPIQRARLGEALAALYGARRAVEAAAAAETAQGAEPGRIAAAVAQCLLAREVTEAACIRVLALCEHALGMASHDAAGSIDARRRDLSLFLRQATPDDKLARAEEAGSVGEAW